MTRRRHAPRPRRGRRPSRHRGVEAGTVVALAAIASFGLAMGVAVLAGRAPAWLGAAHLAASAVAFAAFARDKSAARRGAPRTPERTLHALSLVGGWPGALLAQRLLRHKTAKASFQAVGWLMAGLHAGACAVLLVLASPGP